MLLNCTSVYHKKHIEKGGRKKKREKNCVFVRVGRVL